MLRLLLSGMTMAAVTGAAVLAGTCNAHAQQQPIKMRVGWNQSPGHLASVLFLNKDNLKHAGKSYVVETIRFRGSTPAMQALAVSRVLS